MKKLLWVSLIALMFAGAAFAQTGSVAGIVVDAQGNAVDGARVSLWAGGRCLMNVATDAAGAFTLANVAAGTYSLRVGKPHVGNAVLDGVVVNDGEITNVGTITLNGQQVPPLGGKNQSVKYQNRSRQQGQ
jgi:hypothetical protein